MASIPAPRTTTLATPRREADWLVLALVLASLLTAWLVRQQALTASETVNLNGLQMALPAGSIAAPSDGQYAAVTPDGLTVRVNQLPPPPAGTAGVQALAVNRALQQGQTLTLYRVIANTPTTVNNTPGVVLDYAYVQDAANPASTTGLTVMRGSEVLVGRGNQVYSVALEAPESQWPEVQSLWPRLLASLTLPNT